MDSDRTDAGHLAAVLRDLATHLVFVPRSKPGLSFFAFSTLGACVIFTLCSTVEHSFACEAWHQSVPGELQRCLRKGGCPHYLHHFSTSCAHIKLHPSPCSSL